MTSSEAYPRSVTPGIETQMEDGSVRPPPPGIHARLDWLRFTAHADQEDRLVHMANQWFGDGMRESSGAMFFRRGLTWDPGVQVSLGHMDELCMIDVRGERLRNMNGNDQMRLLEEIKCLGMKPTRIDCALDWIGQEINLYNHATSSCDRGELCLLRRYSPDPEFSASGKAIRKLLKLGKRNSSVCARIYDKGLERGLDVEGFWERLEVEWKRDKAQQIACGLVEAGDRWPSILAGFVLGAVDFREANGRSEIDRRRRADWWAALVACASPATVRCTPEQPVTFQRWSESFRRSYGRRIMQMAAAVGATPSEVADWLLRGTHPLQGPSPVVTEFCDRWEKAY